MATPTLSIVIPAFDEAHRIGATLTHLVDGLDGVVPGGWEIVVVDDGSTDATTAQVERFAADDERVRLLRVDDNEGKGAALRRGFARARSELVLFLDADLPVSVPTIARLVAAMPGHDLVAGSRRTGEHPSIRSQPWPRRLGGRAFLALAAALGFTGLSDPQCGVKVLRRTTTGPVIDATTTSRFAFDLEVLELARRSALSITEVAIDWQHVAGSSIRPVRDAVVTARDLLALRRRLGRRLGRPLR